MSCQEIAVLLLADAVGTLEPGEEAALHAHLASCKECPARGADDALHAAFARAERRAPADSWARVASALPREAARRPLPVPALRWPLGAAAAILVGGLALASFAYIPRHTHRAMRPPLEVRFDTRVPVGGVACFTDPLDPKDPPEVVPDNALDGTPCDQVSAEDPGVATVEWVLPEDRTNARFLVQGVSPGEATFTLRMKSGASRRYRVVIEGDSRHARLAHERRTRLAELDGDALRAEIGRQLALAETATPRRAVSRAERASEALDALAKWIDKSGVADPDLDTERTRVRASLERTRDVWRRELSLARERYKGFLARKQWTEAEQALVRLVQLVGDDCELDAQRWRLIHDHVFVVNGYGHVLEATACVEEGD